MFFFREPSEESIRAFISSQQDAPFSYSEVGATKHHPPSGYNVDHNRIKLGDGEDVYNRAVAALKIWGQFELGWVKIVPAGSPLVVGVTVAVRARAFGSWSLNACRIVYLINEHGPVRKFGFAYGTLPDHVERGEEKFTIEQNADGSVWYDILSFSRPAHPLARLGFPLARVLQKRFARESLAAMVVASR